MCYLIDDFPYHTHAHNFSKKFVDSSRSKQLWIELLYWYKTSRITVLNQFASLFEK